jgi:hypothetical protein
VITSHGKQITDGSREARFFLEPVNPLHRQYEALRAYFVEGLPSAEAARRFGYTPGAFRVLCHQFRRTEHLQERFFREIRHGPQAAPARDPVRDLVVALRKKNLSVYDIQAELATQGHTISINSLSVLLREEGFARLPQRRDEERPARIKPERAEVADVRQLDLAPRSFRTPAAGLFLFVPLMRHLDLKRVAVEAQLPGSKMVPAQQALRSLLALKLIGKERKSHVMNLVFDEGLALFAGLNVMPKRSYLAAYSSSIGEQGVQRFMEVWFQHAQCLGLSRSGSLDLDFHSVPANSEKEPLQKHYVSRRSRSRSQKGVLVFLARDAEQRVMCYCNAHVPKCDQADEILHFVEFWKQQTGQPPQELVFDSQLTTYANLRRLEEQDIRFLTLRRRTRTLLAAIYARPNSAWRRITLRSLTRSYRTPRVFDERIALRGYGHKPIRQLSILDLGHEEPTILLTNDLNATPSNLITRYAQRMLIENGIAEAIHFFHIDALSSMVGLKIDFDLQLTLMASSLYRVFAQHLPENYRRATAKVLFDNLLDISGTVDIEERRVVVTLDKRAHNPYLVDSGLADQPTPMPWLDNKDLVIAFA